MGAYEELSGDALPPPALPKAAVLRHQWQLVEQWDKAVRSRCKRCQLVRVRITYTDRFPSVRYTQGDVITQGKAPPCVTASPSGG